MNPLLWAFTPNFEAFVGMNTLENSSGAFMQSVFETAVDGIVVIDQRGIMLTANPSAGKLFGYTLKEMVGVNVNLLMPNPHQAQHDHYIHRYLKTGEARIIGIGREVPGRKKDGSTFPFRLSISEVFLDDGEVGFTGIIHDISEVKRVELELRELNTELEGKVRERTEELSKAVNRLLTTNSDLEHEVGERRRTENKLRKMHLELEDALNLEKELGDLKSRFLTLASHEFRTPLTTILSSASLIGRYDDDAGQVKRLRHIERINSAVRTLTGLLEDFLSVGRLEEGKIKPNFEPANLEEQIREWTHDFKETLWKEGTLEFHCAEETAFNASTDLRILQTILLNLLSNAVKYSTEPIQIKVSLSRQDGLVLISVQDNGIGVPGKDMEHLTERFFRATNVSHIQGTGLGLHIVREYAELLGGTLSIQSTADSGSTFTVVLPLVR